MSCERYAQAIVDHACGAPLAGDVERHLATCEKCRALLEAQLGLIQGLDAELHQALAVQVSDGFARAVRVRAQEASRRSTRARWWSLAAVPAAVAIALLLRPSPPASTNDTPAIPSRPIVQAAAPQTPVQDISPAREGRTPGRSRSNRARSLPPVDVLVPPNRDQALSRFLTLVRNGRLDASTLAASAEGEPAPPDDLVLVPLTIDPIPMPDVEISRDPLSAGRGPQ